MNMGMQSMGGAGGMGAGMGPNRGSAGNMA